MLHLHIDDHCNERKLDHSCRVSTVPASRKLIQNGITITDSSEHSSNQQTDSLISSVVDVSVRCSICGVRFGRVTTLRYHMKMLHPSEKLPPDQRHKHRIGQISEVFDNGSVHGKLSNLKVYKYTVCHKIFRLFVM